jgi:uncharacterized repeat protein (TIGR03809 family)
MTDRTDVARGRDIVARWSALAEQRLNYLTELYETGRWRRYHSEHDFLENIREARGAVETWRGLLNGEATADNRPVDLSWIGRGSSVPLPKREVPIRQAPAIAPQLPQPVEVPQPVAVPQAVEARPVSVMPDDMPQPAAVTAEPVLLLDSLETPDESALDKTLALTLDIVAMAERYPLLRNAFQGGG